LKNSTVLDRINTLLKNYGNGFKVATIFEGLNEFITSFLSDNKLLYPLSQLNYQIDIYLYSPESINDFMSYTATERIKLFKAYENMQPILNITIENANLQASISKIYTKTNFAKDVILSN